MAQSSSEKFDNDCDVILASNLFFFWGGWLGLGAVQEDFVLVPDQNKSPMSYWAPSKHVM